MKRILVTGGAGFIGSHLVDRLLAERDWRVTVVDDFNDFYDPEIKRANIFSHLQNPHYKIVEADIRDPQAVKQVFAESNFDCVVHLAARAGVATLIAGVDVEAERGHVRHLLRPRRPTQNREAAPLLLQT